MITSIVGRTFLTAYNTKYEKNYTPKEFFENIYWALFYNHGKYMMWITNSPFVQMKAGQKPHLLSEAERSEKLLNLYEKVKSESPDASFAMGYPASEAKEFASTSGLVSDLSIPADEDEIYLSWIGSGLGVGVAGGYTILFDDPAITLQTFEGWQYYRSYLNDPALEKLRGNQINSWNGQWLTYSLGTEYQEKFDFTRLSNEGVFSSDASMAEVNTISWSRLFFSLSYAFPNISLMGYVYGFGQTNKTIGFIPFQLKDGTKLIEVYKRLYGNVPTDKNKFEALFGMHIKRACELGSIGLQALRPDSLKKYMTESKTLNLSKEEDTINYYVYKTWLIAMLTRNKQEITDYTMTLAETMQRYRSAGTKLDRKTLIEKELFGSTSKKGFIEALTHMIKDLDGEDLLTIKKLKDEIHLMTNEEYNYFSTLLKFDYTFVEKQS